MHISVDAPHLPWLAALHDNAVATLDRNVVTDQRGTFIRAGAGYPDPWTRDAALNSWGAANLLRPAAARDTLVRVCEEGPDGGHVIAQDDQWWDQIVWVIAAHDHALWTGDRAFLAEAFAIGTASLAILDATRFRPRWGLYAGPALMQDGISGLPTPPATPTETSSFVLDYPDAHEVMSLSTNLVYVAALRSLDAMGTELGGSEAVAAAARFGMRADELVTAVREHLGDGHTFGYFRHGSDAGSDADGTAGTLDTHREAAGLALAALFGAATDPHAALRSIARGPFGPVNVGPHFPTATTTSTPDGTTRCAGRWSWDSSAALPRRSATTTAPSARSPSSTSSSSGAAGASTNCTTRSPAKRTAGGSAATPGRANPTRHGRRPRSSGSCTPVSSERTRGSADSGSNRCRSRPANGSPCAGCRTVTPCSTSRSPPAPLRPCASTTRTFRPTGARTSTLR
ncbi:hypothetical protein P9139_21570 [Curtobacterium flaccumfaciens]|nr:hypothetical protein P9139_21570 [Curtobacterium flaccumfaciens]